MAGAWSGTISFGLVNIPVTLYPAFKSQDIEFHLLHRKDHGRISYQKVCKKCGKVLQPEDIVKAYELEKEEYVTLEKEELEKGKSPNTRTLEITVFVKVAEIDPKLYERPYYLLPGKKSEPLYVLLREAIRASGMIGVGKIQFGNKEHLAALSAEGSAIMLNLMHFADEIEDPKNLNFPSGDIQVRKKELDLAKQLVTSLAGHFDPEEFRDTHRTALEKHIQEKVGTRGPVDMKSKEVSGKVIDLMERLKKSVEEAEKEPERHYKKKKAG